MESAVPVLEPASSQALAIHSLFVQVLLVSAVIFAIVATLVVVALLRGRRLQEIPHQEHGHHTSELKWMIGPVVVVIWLIAVSAKLVMTINAAPADPASGEDESQIIVTGHQWWWEVRYPEGDVISANEIHIPAGRKLRVKLQSDDVIHSFWVPQLGRKMDAIPGVENYLWLEADKPGVYQGRCAEYCGAQHTWMEFKVYAHAEAEYEQWRAREAAAPAVTEGDETATGRALFMKLACSKCHAIAGTEAKADIAPDLTHLASRRELAGGVIENSPENLRLWLKNPEAIKPGSKMPNFKLSEEHLDQLTAYLETLK